MKTYDVKEFGSHKAAYNALLKDSGLKEPNRNNMITINRVYNTPDKEMLPVRDLLASLYLYPIKETIDPIRIGDRVKLVTYSNGDCILV